MNVGDLVQLKYASTASSKNRWAIVTKFNSWSGFCKIVFMDTGHEWDAAETALIIRSSVKDKRVDIEK